mmetsp:Transcript_159182/g.510595  ORF Transcript_159182/g.510595 Transcript_159182/m.510595 type:complete len:294 (+) Transcript_159182:1352-2233(+)
MVFNCDHRRLTEQLPSVPDLAAHGMRRVLVAWRDGHCDRTDAAEQAAPKGDEMLGKGRHLQERGSSYLRGPSAQASADNERPQLELREAQALVFPGGVVDRQSSVGEDFCGPGQCSRQRLRCLWIHHELAASAVGQGPLGRGARRKRLGGGQRQHHRRERRPEPEVLRERLQREVLAPDASHARCQRRAGALAEEQHEQLRAIGAGLVGHRGATLLDGAIVASQTVAVGTLGLLLLGQARDVHDEPPEPQSRARSVLRSRAACGGPPPEKHEGEALLGKACRQPGHQRGPLFE